MCTNLSTCNSDIAQPTGHIIVRYHFCVLNNSIINNQYKIIVADAVNDDSPCYYHYHYRCC